MIICPILRDTLHVIFNGIFLCAREYIVSYIYRNEINS
jgi:hypothetical protein